MHAAAPNQPPAPPLKHTLTILAPPATHAGADLANLMNEAAILAARRNLKEISKVRSRRRRWTQPTASRFEQSQARHAGLSLLARQGAGSSAAGLPAVVSSLPALSPFDQLPPA